jgi:hypothetical protein
VDNLVIDGRILVLCLHIMNACGGLRCGCFSLILTLHGDDWLVSGPSCFTP